MSNFHKNYDPMDYDESDFDLDEDDVEHGICPNCSGSGEGNFDGSTCFVCGGSGEI
jgi:DnaJ-class molecular chaperone